jgi:hypothetical protein
VLSLLDSGEVVKSDGSLILSSCDLEVSHALPRTIHQAVTRRLERLPQGLQEVLSVASVLGRSFAFRDLALLAESGTEKIEEAVERLVAVGFLEEERASHADRLAFVSGVTREVLYAALPRRQRRKLHKRYAEELTRKSGDSLLFETAVEVERVVRANTKVYPNVDFYSGLCYHAMKIPSELFTPIFAVSRVVGWTAHVLEQWGSNRIIRPRADYTGPENEQYVPIDER